MSAAPRAGAASNGGIGGFPPGCRMVTWEPYTLPAGLRSLGLLLCVRPCAAMLAARALGRAAALGARCSASLAASGASALTESAGGAGKGGWSEYSRALARLGHGGPLGSWRDEEERSKAGAPKSLHTGGACRPPERRVSAAQEQRRPRRRRRRTCMRQRSRAPHPPRASSSTSVLAAF